MLMNPDDVIKWKYFSRYWPFVWGIHRSPVNSLHKGQWHGALMFSMICDWINAWKHSWIWWFEKPSRSFWRRCNDAPFADWKRIVSKENKACIPYAKLMGCTPHAIGNTRKSALIFSRLSNPNTYKKNFSFNVGGFGGSINFNKCLDGLVAQLLAKCHIDY